MPVLLQPILAKNQSSKNPLTEIEKRASEEVTILSFASKDQEQSLGDKGQRGQASRGF